MKTLTPTTLTLLTTLVTLIPACETAELDAELDAEFVPELGPEPTHVDPAESGLGLLEPAEDEALATLTCAVDDQAAVGGLHYPGWTCANAIAHAETSLGGYHYRNACNQQVGSDISSPADEALVTSCTIVSGNAVVSVDLCCEPPATVPGIPQGTWKFCIAAGTPQQMLASCESGAQTWATWFGNGTYSTQQYTNMWGDPCPVGTSLVPNSQFYVANSCNPLPNVGAGCGGPGSFNYEYKIGVMCQ